MSNQSLREAVQQALDSLNAGHPYKALELLRVALAQPDDKAVVPNFGLGGDQLDKLLTNSLKPDEIAGTNFVRRRRIQELVHWFVRLANGNANPKWLHEHAFEMAYYIATNVPQPPVERLTVPSRTSEMNAAVRKVLKHHGLTEHGDGVVETDLIEAVLACLPASAVSPAEQGVAAKAIAAAHEQHRHYRETMRTDEQGAELSDYPPLPKPDCPNIWGGAHSEKQMRAYVDADRAARGGAA